MKKRIAILVRGYYPHFDPIGQVFEKIRPIIGAQCEMEFFHLRQKLDEPSTIIYEGCQIHAVSNLLYDMHIANGRLSWFWRHIARLIFLVFYAPRLETKEDNLAAAFCRSVERRHKELPFDVVLSFSAPLVMHSAALRFRQRHPEVKWVTYSADTTFDNPVLPTCVPVRALRSHYVKKRNELELRLYSLADVNLFTPEIMLTLSRMQGVTLPKNSSVVEYPFFDASVVEPDASEFKDPTSLNFLYAGGVDPIIRSPDYMIDVFRQLPDELNVVCHIFLTGYPSSSIEKAVREFPKRFVLHNPVSYERMQRIMKAADALINLGNNSNSFSPSKLYDYFSTGLPILSFVYAGKNRSEIFDRYPFSLELVNFSDPVLDSVKLLSFCKGLREKRTSSLTASSLFPEHSLGTVTSKFLKAFTISEV